MLDDFGNIQDILTYYGVSFYSVPSHMVVVVILWFGVAFQPSSVTLIKPNTGELLRRTCFSQAETCILGKNVPTKQITKAQNKN